MAGDEWELLAPIVPPKTWAAGVTDERSRDARWEESRPADVYDLVPPGSVLPTGTGVVPPYAIRPTAGQSVEITISRIGTLRNPVAAGAASEDRTEETAHG